MTEKLALHVSVSMLLQVLLSFYMIFFGILLYLKETVDADRRALG